PVRPGLGTRWEDRADLLHQPLVGDTRLRGHGDLVELPGLAEQLLCSREGEAGERRAADRGHGAELDDAGESQSFDRADGLHADLLTDLEVLLPCCRLV